MEQDYSDAPQPNRRRRPANQASGARPQRSANGQQRGQQRSANSHNAHRTQSRNPQARRAAGARPQARRAQGSGRRPAQGAQSYIQDPRVARRQGQGRPQGNGNRRPQQRKGISTSFIAAGVIGVLLIGVIGWLLFGLLTRFDVTVNGERVTLGHGSTIQTILDRNLVDPTPGNLLAVDGKVISKGDGAPCTAVVDGKEVPVDFKLSGGNVVEITDGYDTTEEATVTEETIPFEKDEGDRSFEAYWFGSIHLLSDGEDGVKTVSTGKESGKTVSEVTKEPINAGYRIYSANPDEKVVALTFDDGPWPDTTDEILDILEENGAKASFFTIGEQIADYADEVKRAVKMGCKVYTHTWDHAAGSGGGVSIANMSATEQVDEIKKGYKAIADVTGEEPDHILRAPGGNFYGDVIDNLWDYVDAEIGWDVDTEDWSRPGVEAIESAILSVRSGQVILMHDGGGDRSQTVEALRNALPQLVEEGFKFVTIDELIAYGLPSSTSSIPTTKDLESEDEESDSETETEDEESETSTSSGTSSSSSTSSESDSETSTEDSSDSASGSE